MNSPKFTKYSSKIENYDEHKWTAVHGLRHSIVRFAPALQLPLLSLQYTRYYVQDGIISKTSPIDFWTKAQQPINLSPIFARRWHHISICFKPFHVNQQARCLSLLKVPVRWFLAHRSIVWWLSLICHDCFVSLWFAVRLCVIQLYAHALCQQNIAGPLVLNIMTSNRFHNICPAWDGVWQSSNVFNEGQAFPLSWFSHHLVELI